MRTLVTLAYLALTTMLLSCDRQDTVANVDPGLGVDCFESHRDSLPPGTQYEGIDSIDENRLVIKIMNGIEVTTIECALNSKETLQGTGE